MFLLQLVYQDGEVARFAAGGAVELDLERALVEKVREKNIGLLRTTGQVESAVRQAFREVMYDFKRQVSRPTKDAVTL